MWLCLCCGCTDRRNSTLIQIRTICPNEENRHFLQCLKGRYGWPGRCEIVAREPQFFNEVMRALLVDIFRMDYWKHWMKIKFIWLLWMWRHQNHYHVTILFWNVLIALLFHIGDLPLKKRVLECAKWQSKIPFKDRFKLAVNFGKSTLGKLPNWQTWPESEN